MKKHIISSLLSAALVLSFAGCGSSQPAAPSAPSSAPSQQDTPAASEDVTLEFVQWWEPELPEGSLRQIMDQFEAENPGIKVKLLSGPYASTKEQVVAGAAAGTMSDVVGLDGAWVSDFVKQGSIADLSQLMQDAGYDDSQLASQVALDGSTYMIPVVNFVYPMFVNNEVLNNAGVDKVPVNRTEFMEAAKKITDPEKNIYAWICPLSLETPNGIQNDVMSWVWSSGKSMLKDGRPDLVNPDIKDAMTYIKTLYDAKVIAPGAFTMKEQDKVEEFTNGRVGMMISSLAHINTIRTSNEKLDFSIAAMPVEDGYTGKQGIPYASWGIGIAENSPHKAEAWKLVEFLMSEKTNSELSSIANAFPGNVNSEPDFVKTDGLFGAAFEIYKSGYPQNEFVGLPVAEDLMRSFDEELQKMLTDEQSVDDMLKNAQTEWEKEFN